MLFLLHNMYFDIGANIGRWSIENIDTCDKIVAVEADPETYNTMSLNCAISDRIKCENYAVCDNNGDDITFYKSSTNTLSTLNKDWLSHPSSRFYNYGSYSEIICKTITIDALIEKHGIPELIKIDVEGGEFNCIKSLTQKVNNLCFEWASETNDITFNCLDYLYSLGFSKFYMQKEDKYTFRPNAESHVSIDELKSLLLKTIPKQDWGMIWCK